MKLRPSILPSTPVSLVQGMAGGNLNTTDSSNPNTVTQLGNAATYDGFAGVQVYSWFLFDRAYKNPYLSIFPDFDLDSDKGHALTGTFNLYLFTGSIAPWTPTTLCWNNQPGFPSDPDLIATMRVQPSGGGAYVSQIVNDDNFGGDNITSIVMDLRKKSPAVSVWGCAATAAIDQGPTGEHESFARIFRPQVRNVILPGQQFSSVAVTNRASDGSGNITLTTATAHGLALGSYILVSGVGIDINGANKNYDTYRGTIYRYYRWTTCNTGTTGTTIKYTAMAVSPDAESAACGGTVSFFPTGL